MRCLENDSQIHNHPILFVEQYLESDSIRSIHAPNYCYLANIEVEESVPLDQPFSKALIEHNVSNVRFRWIVI